MSASLVQHTQQCTCTCHTNLHCAHHRGVSHSAPGYGYGLPIVNFSAHTPSTYLGYNGSISSPSHVFYSSTVQNPPTNVVNVHNSEPRVYPAKGGHIKHTHVSYRRESIPELNVPGPMINGFPNSDKVTTIQQQSINNWVLCLPIPVPHGDSGAILESLVYSVRYASSNAGSASVQTDVVVCCGNTTSPEGIMTDYSQIPLYAHHGSAVDEKSGQGQGYGPPMINEALCMSLSSVPAFKGAGETPGWSHFLDHQRIHPNVEIAGGYENPCVLYLFFHVYEYPGQDAMRSISADVSVTWNDSVDNKMENDRERVYWKTEQEKLALMKEEVEKAIARFEEVVEKASEDERYRRERDEYADKVFKEKELKLAEMERNSKDEHLKRIREGQEQLKALEDAEKKAKMDHEWRLKEEETRFRALEEAEELAKVEYIKRVKDEEGRLKALDDAERRAEEAHYKLIKEEEARLREIEESQLRIKEEHDEVERKARAERERLACEEAERKATETERISREEADRKAREGAERLAMEAADHKAKEEAERTAREEADRQPKIIPSISQAPPVADEHMQTHIAQVAARLGQKCKNGYAWQKKTHGYKCSGGGHFISFKDLGMN